MKLNRKFIKMLTASIFCFVFYFFSNAQMNPFGIDLPIKSEAVYLINTDTNTLIYEKNKDVKMASSALVKMMTVILALESDEFKQNPKKFLNTKIEATSDIFDRLYLKGASNANIKLGEQITIKDALYAIMINSACEATMMLVNHLTNNNPEKFVDQMNEKAEKIGMQNTNFTDPDGLDTEQQLTTAYDMYLLTKYCMKNKLFKKIATTSTYEIASTNIRSTPIKLIHTNKMLSRFLGGKNYDSRMKGIKTGRVDDKENLITIASEKSYNYLLIILGAPKEKNENLLYKETKDLFDWVFKNLKLEIIATPYENIIPHNIKVEMSKKDQELSLTPKDSVTILLPKTIDKSTIFWDVSSLPKTISAPIKKGDEIGTISLKLSDQEIKNIKLIAAQDVQVNIISFITYKTLKIITSWWFIAIISMSLLLFILIIKNNKFKKSKTKSKKFKKYKHLK